MAVVVGSPRDGVDIDDVEGAGRGSWRWACLCSGSIKSVDEVI